MVEEKIIKEIKFGILSPDEIRKMSVVAITTDQLYDPDGRPIPGRPNGSKVGRCHTRAKM